MKLGILTISDSVPVGKRVDESGPKIQESLGPFFHSTEYRLCNDDVSEILKNVKQLLAETSLVISNGGTGLMDRDNTISALSHIEGVRLRPLERAISAAMILACGPMAAIATPTVLKINNKFIVALPGKTDEVEAALEQVVKPFFLAHLIFGNSDHIKG
jgi:molybdenum cofactor synthesis domain-containing protein